MGKVRFVIDENERGKFAWVNYSDYKVPNYDGDFALIDRKFQDKVQKGEEWEGIVKKTIKDKRGKDVAILIPEKPIYRVEDEKVYCGIREVGKPEVGIEKRINPIFALNDYGVEVSIYKVYKFQGEILGKKWEDDIRYWHSDLDKIKDREIKELLASENLRKEWLKWLKETIEKEKPFKGNRDKQMEEIKSVVKEAVEKQRKKVNKLEKEVEEIEEKIEGYKRAIERAKKWLREKGVKEVRHYQHKGDRETIEVEYEDGRIEKAEATFSVQYKKEYDEEFKEWDFYVDKHIISADENWDRLSDIERVYRNIPYYRDKIQELERELEEKQRELMKEREKLEKMEKAKLEIREPLEGYMYGIWEYNGHRILPLERDVWDFYDLPLVYQVIENEDWKTLEKVKGWLEEANRLEKEDLKRKAGDLAERLMENSKEIAKEGEKEKITKAQKIIEEERDKNLGLNL